MVSKVIDNTFLNKWEELDNVKFALKKGYTKTKDSNLYTLTDKKFTRYVLDCDYYYPEDIGHGYTKDDVMLNYDNLEFWASTNNPVKELSERLQEFEYICKNVIEELNKNTNTFGLNRDTLPVNCDDLLSLILLIVG